MSIFWSLIEGLNGILINSLSCESGTHEGANIKESSCEDEWYKQLHYSIEHDGRYKCEKILIDYFIDRNIDVYRI